ncbi:uncharacterized protein LOC126249192 [Schistocerca nitens]|uniref:uncharacterized protein LOC126249192 n=1 Tax=Schistocerca nitens TaxID=7011 RepID=UPI0021189DB4|nr:uncharacterized protein LOC126249192 [Schistocerca nitens]
MDIHVLQSQPAQKVAFKDSSTVRVGNKLVRNKPPTQPSAMRPERNSNAVKSNVQTASEAGVVVPPAQPTSCHLVRGGFQPRLPTSLPPPGQQQQPSPLPRRQPIPLMPPAQLHAGAPRVVAPAPAVPLQSPPPSELMDVDPSAGPPSQAVAVQPVLQPLSLGTPKESDTAAPCPAPTQQPSTQRQETLPLFVGPDAPSRPVPEAAPVVTGVHPDLGFQSVFPEAPRSQCWGRRSVTWEEDGATSFIDTCFIRYEQSSDVKDDLYESNEDTLVNLTEGKVKATIKAKMFDPDVPIVLDRGVTINLMSQGFFQELKKRERLTTLPVQNSKVQTATG